jgi:hypothetical protein
METVYCCQLPLIREVARQEGAKVPWNFVNGRQCNHRQNVLDQLCDRNSSAESGIHFGKRKMHLLAEGASNYPFSVDTHTHHEHAQKTYQNTHL